MIDMPPDSGSSPGEKPARPTFFHRSASAQQSATAAEPMPEPDASVAVTPIMRATPGGDSAPTHNKVLQRLESSNEEQQLLRLLIHDTDNVILRIQTPRSTWFSTPQHQRVYLAWRQLYEAGMPVTPDAVIRTLREQARPEELELVQMAYNRVMGCDVTDAAENLAYAVRNAAQCRRFSALVNSMSQGFYQNYPIDELWAQAATELAQAEDHESFVPFQQQLKLTLKEILHPELSDLGLLTQLNQIDTLCGGLEPYQMYVIGGIQGSGKTALYLEIIIRLMEFYPDVAVCVMSLEMHQKRLQQRQLSNLSYVSTRRMKDHAKPGNTPLREDEVKRIGDAYEQIAAWGDRIEMHFQKTTCDDIRTIARRFALRHRDRRKVLIYDHVGLTAHKSNDLNVIITDTIRTLKEVQTEFGYATIPIGQMTKDLEKPEHKATYHRPDQSFMYCGGFINQTADTVFCTWRPEVYTDTMEMQFEGGRKEYDWVTKNRMILVTGKNRDGAPNKQLVMGCNMEFMQLYNMEEEKKYQLQLPLSGAA